MKENKYLFSYLAIFFIGSMILLWNIETGQLVVFFSNHRSAFLNTFFKVVNLLGEEWAYVISALVLVRFDYRMSLGVGITALVATIFTQSLKYGFQHPRPMRYFSEQCIEDQIILVEGILPHMGMNSFPSGHTASVFALFIFIALIIAEKKWIPFILVILAIIAGMARIYLVQHFFKDVVFGAFIGTSSAFISFYLQKLLWKNNISSLHF
jgi:membrane-associated phospholipid phosphatase